MSITVMKQALEALEYIDNNYMSLPKAGNEAITTLRTAIEQAERQETNQVTLTQTNIGIGERGMEAYEAAKERGWVGLSDERLMEMPKQEPVEYCTAYYCAGDCGQPHNQKEMQEFLRAQPEQEPVKLVEYNCRCGRVMKFESEHGVVAPQRTWVGLTDEERIDIAYDAKRDEVVAVKLTEAKLRSKNT